MDGICKIEENSKTGIKILIENEYCNLGDIYSKGMFVEEIRRTGDNTEIVEIYDNIEEKKLGIWHYTLSLYKGTIVSIDINNSSLTFIDAYNKRINIDALEKLADSIECYTYCTCPEFYKEMTEDTAKSECKIANKSKCSHTCIFYTLKNKRIEISELGIKLVITTDYLGKQGISRIELI